MGKGTNDLFYEDPSILFISSHQSGSYPGTGKTREAGSGDGEGFTINLPLPGALLLLLLLLLRVLGRGLKQQNPSPCHRRAVAAAAAAATAAAAAAGVCRLSVLSRGMTQHRPKLPVLRSLLQPGLWHWLKLTWQSPLPHLVSSCSCSLHTHQFHG